MSITISTHILPLVLLHFNWSGVARWCYSTKYLVNDDNEFWHFDFSMFDPPSNFQQTAIKTSLIELLMVKDRQHDESEHCESFDIREHEADWVLARWWNRSRLTWPQIVKAELIWLDSAWKLGANLKWLKNMFSDMVFIKDWWIQWL